MPRRLFTREEAQALLPRLTELLTALQAQQQELREKERALAARYQQRVRGNGYALGGEDLVALQAELEAGLAALNEQLAAIDALGCELKDIDQGLVDFPAQREGREVYLCWRLGEPTIAWWHERDAGFAGRQPL
ncbi:MAG TPA: DUF2203 domain-containing protein [Chloroflexota bacterium]|nr:DUF2203 domain-containing protein [Chloroflexota bacterium]HZU07348.1 DUF2203 domain-containing protein [Chloroflexota bacterium]